jgi:CubicO group peptidase (beta-lactamase class C family)
MADAVDLQAAIDEIGNRRPTVGMALAVVSKAGLESFHGAGVADIASGRPVDADTVFRIGSLTKLFTAILVLQLWEEGRLDLDAPANDYLRAYKLVPAKAGFRPATVRHLLTHTAGIREMLRLSGLLKIDRVLGEALPPGSRMPSLPELYGGELRIDVEPGTGWMYTNHDFATLGQIVEDITGECLGHRYRERIFEPLGMTSTDLGRTVRVRDRLATGYELKKHGAVPVDCELVTPAAGAIYSSTRDMASFAAALLGGGANPHGTVLKAETVRMMFAPQHQPDPRLAGMGLAFFRVDLSGHLGVEHDGIVPGFDSELYLAPDDGLGVLAFANGAKAGMHWLVLEVEQVLRRLLEVGEQRIRDDVPQHPEVWGDLCGSYQLVAPPTDPGKLAMGLGLRIRVSHGRLTASALSPVPALLRGFELHPGDPGDPDVFQIVFPMFVAGPSRAVFSRDQSGNVTALHLEPGPMTFLRKSGRPRSSAS